MEAGNRASVKFVLGWVFMERVCQIVLLTDQEADIGREGKGWVDHRVTTGDNE